MKIDKRLLELRKFVAPEFIFGEGAIKLAGNYCKIFGVKKALIVSDQGVINAGWTEEVVNSVENSEIEYSLFSDVSPNPRDYEVMRGAEAYANQFCDGIIAIGGGSVMDAAKGIGIVAANNREILKFEGVNKVSLPMPPLICIPTTGGTASEVSQFAIINNYQNKYKFAIISKTVVPDLALIDPTTLLTMDNYLTACTGIDALSHAIEAYVSTASSAITDNFAIEAIRGVSRYLPLCIKHPENLDYRANVMNASLQAGLAFSNASLGVVHSMAHSLGGYLDLTHGACNAMLLNSSIDYNFSHAQDKYQRIASEINNSNNMNYTKNELISMIDDFKNSLGVNFRLSDKGVTSTDILPLAQNAINDPCNATNPRIPSIQDIEIMLNEAL
jgi:alcohol dehydrogenase class IV